MGSRGAFVNVEKGNFKFIEGGQTYRSIGEVDGVKVLIKTSGSVKAPEYSHTANSVYAVVQKGQLKHLSYYDENHNQSASIDLLHSHCGLRPHKHLYLNHSDNGIAITKKEQALIDKIRRRYNLK